MSRPKTTDKSKPYQPIRAAAEISGLSRRYIYEGCKNGTISHLKVGTDYRVFMPDLLASKRKPIAPESENPRRQSSESRKERRLRDLLPLLRTSSSPTEDGGEVLLCLECEEWTWVGINVSSGLLDILGDLIVEELGTKDDRVQLWIKTKSFNMPEV